MSGFTFGSLSSNGRLAMTHANNTFDPTADFLALRARFAAAGQRGR